MKSFKVAEFKINKNQRYLCKYVNRVILTRDNMVP